MRFSRAVGEDAYEFLTSYKEKLHVLSLVESRGVDFTTYKLADSSSNGGGHIWRLGHLGPLWSLGWRYQRPFKLDLSLGVSESVSVINFSGYNRAP